MAITLEQASTELEKEKGDIRDARHLLQSLQMISQEVLDNSVIKEMLNAENVMNRAKAAIDDVLAPAEPQETE